MQMERSSQKLYNIEGFYRQKLGETGKSLAKEKGGLFQTRLGEGGGFIRQIASASFFERRGALDRLLVLIRKF